MMTEPGGTGGDATWLSRRTLRALAVAMATYAALVGTHGGEFWPFSTYSMFARAGRPFQRALVRVVNDDTLDATPTPVYSIDALPGAPLLLEPLQVPQNDLSSLVQRAEGWGTGELEALARMFDPLRCRSPLLLLRVHGSLEGGVLEQVAAPVAALTCRLGRVHVQPLVPRAS